MSSVGECIISAPLDFLAQFLNFSFSIPAMKLVTLVLCTSASGLILSPKTGTAALDAIMVRKYDSLPQPSNVIQAEVGEH